MTAVAGSAGVRPAGVDHEQTVFPDYHRGLAIAEGARALLHQADTEAAMGVTGELIRHVRATYGLHVA
jgi:hypothetical protein